MAVTTVVKVVGSSGTFSTPQLWEDGGPASLTTSNRWTAATFAGTPFTQGEVVTGTGITGGKMLDTDNATYITFDTTTTPAAGITVTGSTSLATCVISGTADVGVIWQGQQQNQEFSGAATQLSISGSTASATAYPHYTTVAGASFRDHANVQTNALRYNASNGAALQATGAATTAVSLGGSQFARISNLQVSATGSNAMGLNLATTSVLAEFCLVEGTYTTSGTGGAALALRGFSNTARNCVAIQRATAADHIVCFGTGTGCLMVNCTVVAADDLATAPLFAIATAASGSMTVRNCGLFAGDTGSGVQTGTVVPTYTTNYTDTNTPPAGVTQVTYANEFQDVNDATRDFRLKSAASQIDSGTTDATNAAIDIAGTARPNGAAYDVGAWEFVQGAAGSVTWFGGMA